MVKAYIGLGSNLEYPLRQVKQAIAHLKDTPCIALLKKSRFYNNPPMNQMLQPNYVNAVISIQTSLNPHQLLQVLLAVEQKMGRVRDFHWGPRIIDLDLLLYANVRMHDKELELPHPGIKHRAFVACLLYEIEPNIQLPDGTLLKDIVQSVDSSLLTPITKE